MLFVLTKGAIIFLKAWGKPHIEAIEWSEDGEILWLPADEQDQLLAARKNGDRWTLQVLNSENIGGLGVKFFAFNQAQAAWVEDQGKNHEVMQIKNILTGELRTLHLPPGLQVNWMSW